MDGSARTIHVDCDTGIDDAMALLYLLLDDRITVTGISTVFGNIAADVAAENCLRILELLNRTQVPVAIGAERTIRGDIPELAPHVHGPDGLGGVGLPAARTEVSRLRGAELIIQSVREQPGEIHLLATGPLTNLAAALALEPDLPSMVRGVTIMGGAADAPGNQTVAAEANILHDPEAAQAVLSAPWDITLVPLDVTMTELLTEDHRDLMARSQSGVAQFVARITNFYFDFFRQESFAVRCSPCHDALAAAIAIGDVVPLDAPTINVQVECGDGPARGTTLCDTRGKYRHYPPQDGARCTVVLKTEGTFPDLLVERFVNAG